MGQEGRGRAAGVSGWRRGVGNARANQGTICSALPLRTAGIVAPGY